MTYLYIYKLVKSDKAHNAASLSPASTCVGRDVQVRVGTCVGVCVWVDETSAACISTCNPTLNSSSVIVSYYRIKGLGSFRHPGAYKNPRGQSHRFYQSRMKFERWQECGGSRQCSKIENASVRLRGRVR